MTRLGDSKGPVKCNIVFNVKRFGTIHRKRVFQLNYLNDLKKKNANEFLVPRTNDTVCVKWTDIFGLLIWFSGTLVVNISRQKFSKLLTMVRNYRNE